MEENGQTFEIVKQEREEEDCLYPFVCGLCGYRFNRINEYCRHFEVHSDMVTSEYFHSCHNETWGVDETEDSAKYFTCGVCNQEFATLCLLHDHFCQKYNDGGLYIVDAVKRRGIPRDRRCVGTVFTGSMVMPEVGEVVKTEITEDDGDDDMEEDEINDIETSMSFEENDTSSQSQESIDESRKSKRIAKKLGTDSGIAIQKITVNFGDHTETYDVGKNDVEQREKRVVKIDADEEAKSTDKALGVTATESEADEDMSDDLEKGEHNYGLSSEGDSPVKKAKQRKRVKKNTVTFAEEDLFDSYEKAENLKARRGDSTPVPASEIKTLMAKAKLVGEDKGSNSRVYCPVCDKIVLKTYLYQHFKKAHSDEQFPCHLCGKIFSNKGYRSDHLRFFHQGVRKSRGEGNGGTKFGRNYKAESRAILEKAKLVGEEDGNNTKVECPVCNKVLLRHYLVKHHQKLHSDKKYPCNQCDKVFQYSGYLSDHKRYVHQGKKKKSMLTRYAKEPDIIALCDSAQLLDRKKGEKPKVACPKCHKTISKEYLAKHLRAAHSDQKFPCDVCGKVYSCKRFLYEHQKYVHMDKDTECEVCKKMFKGLAAKEKHRRMIHTDERPFQCTICGNRFRTSFERKRHMSQHEDINLVPYQCPKCERRFKSQKSMLSHERSVHRRVGRLMCKWPGCNRILNDKATFRKHYCIHTGEKPHKCPVCGKGFIQRVALKYHLKTKHDSEDKMPPGKSPVLGEQRVKHGGIQLFREAQPVPLDPDEYVEEYTEVPVENIVEGTQVNLSDASIVSDLIEIAQSSEGGTVPEALQHVFDGENRTIVIYYQ